MTTVQECLPCYLTFIEMLCFICREVWKIDDQVHQTELEKKIFQNNISIKRNHKYEKVHSIETSHLWAGAKYECFIFAISQMSWFAGFCRENFLEQKLQHFHDFLFYISNVFQIEFLLSAPASKSTLLRSAADHE